MFILRNVDSENKLCYIADTKDRSIEPISFTDLENIVRVNGVSVLGLYLIFLGTPITKKIIARVFSSDCVVDYDGYYISQMSGDVDTEYYQIYNVVSTDFSSEEDFLFFCDCLRVRNSTLYDFNVLNNMTSTHRIMNLTVEKEYFTIEVESLSTGKCSVISSFMALVSGLVSQSMKIDGVNYRDGVFQIDFLGQCYTIDSRSDLVDLFGAICDTQEKLLSADLILQDCNKSGNPFVHKLESTWDTIYDTFQGDVYKKLKSFGLPLYNIRNRIIANPNEESLKTPWFVKYGFIIKDVVKEGLLMANGTIIKDPKDVLRLYNILYYDDELIEKKVLDYVSTIRTKYQLVGDTVSLCIPDGSFNTAALEKDGVAVLNPAFCSRAELSSTYVFSYLHDFALEIVRNDFDDNTRGFIGYGDGKGTNGMVIAGYTNSGTLVYDMNEYKLKMGSHTRMAFKYDSFSLSFMRSYKGNKFDSYYFGSIFPIGVHSIQVVEDGYIDISLAVYYSRESEREGYTDSCLFIVPLLYYGGTMYDYGDFIEVPMLYHTLYLNKSALYGLSSTADSNTVFYNFYQSSRGGKSIERAIAALSRDAKASLMELSAEMRRLSDEDKEEESWE